MQLGTEDLFLGMRILTLGCSERIMKLLSVCEESLNDKYFLQTNKTDLEYPILYAKIRANYTTFVEKESKEMGKKYTKDFY